jgi:dihydroorotase
LFVGGLRPHMYCLPIAKREPHRLALRRAAVSGNPKFFLGTDTAPHPVKDKEADCGCAGIFTAPAALELYAQVFAEEQALDRLEAFASLNGPRFYGLAPNEERVTLVNRPWRIPAEIRAGDVTVKPFLAGEELAWQLES